MYSSGVIDITAEPMGTPSNTEYGAGSAIERTSTEPSLLMQTSTEAGEDIGRDWKMCMILK